MVPNFNFDGGKIGPIGVGVGLSLEMARRGIQNQQKFEQKKAQLSVTIAQNFRDKKISEKVALIAYEDSGFSKARAKALVENMKKLQESTKSEGGRGFYSVSISNGIREYKWNLNVKQFCLKIYASNNSTSLNIEDLPYSVVSEIVDSFSWSEKLKIDLLADIRQSQTKQALIEASNPHFYVYEQNLDPIIGLGITWISILSIIYTVFFNRKKRNRYQ